MEFLNNEDVKQLYVYSKSSSQMVASRSCASDNTHEKGIYFLKTTGASKLTADQMSKPLTDDLIVQTSRGNGLVAGF